jgi:hypothetical protein
MDEASSRRATRGGRVEDSSEMGSGTVESVDDTLARLRANGAELVGEVAQLRTSTNSATCEALRASSSRWPRNSSEAFTVFRGTGGALRAFFITVQ